MYGLNIGLGAYEIPNKITYKYDSHFEMLNDMMGGQSTADYYYNKAANDCLVITSNDNTGRIVAITYFTDLSKVTETISGID